MAVKNIILKDADGDYAIPYVGIPSQTGNAGKVLGTNGESLEFVEKQDTLVSGTNIKTINNQSLLGSGNISISTGGTATDVKINGTSITSNNEADIKTNGTYNATSNKIATMSDIPTNVSSFTNDSGYITSSALSGYATETWVGNQGYITGITSSDVTTALGYTPYNASNPNGYITNSALAPYALSADLASVATSGSYNDLSNKPTIPAAQVNSDWNATSGVAQILNKPTLGTMAAESASDYTPTSSLATVATTGSYNDLSNKPTIPTVNNSTITFTQGGVTKGSFTLNQASGDTIALDAGGGGQTWSYDSTTETLTIS